MQLQHFKGIALFDYRRTLAMVLLLVEIILADLQSSLKLILVLHSNKMILAQHIKTGCLFFTLRQKQN